MSDWKARLYDRAREKGWKPSKLQAKVERRLKLRAAGRGLLGAVVPIAKGVVSTIPFAGLAAKVVSKLPAVVKAPIMRQVVDEGAAQFDLMVALSGGSVFKAILKDLTPAFEYIEDGEWGKAVLSWLFLAGAVAAAAFLYLGA